MITKELCKVCNKHEHSCCKTQPVLTEEEAAKIYFHIDNFPSNVQLTRVANNSYIFAPKHIVRDNQVHIDEEYCIFFDKESGECTIYDYRPEVCRKFGEVKALPCPFSNLTPEQLDKMSEQDRMKLVEESNTVDVAEMLSFSKQIQPNYMWQNSIYKLPKLTKKHLKHIKEDALITIIMYYINKTVQNDKWYLSEKNKYKLVFTDDSQINSVQINELYAKDENVEKRFVTAAKLHNFLHRKILSKPLEYQKLVVQKVNQVLNGLTLKDCFKIEDPELKQKYETIAYYAFSAALFKIYKSEFKNKSKEYQGFKHDDVLQILFDATEETGGYDTDGNLKKLFFNETIRCIIKNAETTYKHLTINIK